MPQLNVYVPDGLAKVIRKEAKRSGRSISDFVTSLLREKLETRRWRPGFFSKVVGGWKGDFPAIERAPAEKLDEP